MRSLVCRAGKEELMKLQYEFDMAKDAGNADDGSASANRRLEIYAMVLKEKKEREKDAE